MKRSATRQHCCCHGVREFPNQLGAGSATSNFMAEAKFGTDWLLRMWDDSTKTFYYQVGIGAGNAKTVGDHDLWRLPAGRRQLRRDGSALSGTSAIARSSARDRPARSSAPTSPGATRPCSALCYQIFKKSDPTFANRCLLAAEHIFDLANTNPGQLTTVRPVQLLPRDRVAQRPGAWCDGALPRALPAAGCRPGLPHTDPAYYLQHAAHWANAYITGPDDAADTLNLYDVSGLAHYELHKALGQAGNPSGPRDDAGRARRRPEEGTRRRTCAGCDRSVPVRVPLGDLGHDLARRGARGDGERVHAAHRHVDLRALERPLAGEHPRRKRLGRVADRR